MKGSRLKVLMVGGDAGSARLMREMLAGASDPPIELAHAQEPPAGPAQLVAGDADVLLLELTPDGERDFAEGVGRRVEAHRLPVVLLADLDDETLAARARELRAQDYVTRRRLDSRTLLRSIRYAIERRQAEEQLRHYRHLASMGEMAAGIAHEIGNSLNNILLYSRLLAPGEASPQTRKDIGVIRSEASRAARLVTDLLSYARRGKPRMCRLDLHKVLRKVLNVRRHQRKAADISLSTSFREGPLYVRGSSSQLVQVFINLVLNAEQALRTSQGGDIIVATEVNGEWATVSVADTGTGIPEETLDKVFDPFFTTKRAGEGTGLGLSTCLGIVNGHGGRIHAANNANGGATFTVELPLAPEVTPDRRDRGQTGRRRPR